MTASGPGSKTSSTRRHRRATSPRKQSALAGPLRGVVYIFEREGARGGGFWWLVLECGHAVSRKRFVGNHWTGMAQLMFKPLSERLAPKRVQCHYCGSGSERQDPWIMIKALGGDVP